MLENLEIRETSARDLENIQALWADKEVMQYIEGFPEGLHKSLAELRDWLAWIEQVRPRLNHYSIYLDDVYCGETFYRIDPDTKMATMDIKLNKNARGKGIGKAGLSHATEQAFAQGAVACCMDPDTRNEKALALYRKLGFVDKPCPDTYETCEGHQYMELSREDWFSAQG